MVFVAGLPAFSPKEDKMKRQRAVDMAFTSLVNPGRNPHTVPTRGKTAGFLSWYSRRTALAVLALLIVALIAPVPVLAEGATQISGIGYFPDAGVCEDFPDDPVDDVIGYFALDMTGDLDGCLYAYVLTAECSPSGAYNETGIDIFVSADGNSSFQTTYRFTAKYEACTNLIGEVID